MGRKWKRFIVFCTLFALFAGIMPDGGTLRATEKANEDYLIEYTPAAGAGSFYTDDMYEAYTLCGNSNGGDIVFQKSCEIGFPEYLSFPEGVKDVRLHVPSGVTLKISQSGFQLRGKLYVEGILDIKNSAGLLWGDGQVIPSGTTEEKIAKQWRKKTYEIEGLEEYRIQSREITYGQTLGDAEIPQEEQACTSSVEGKWEFCQPDTVPDAGKGYFDVKYCPDNALSYGETVYAQGGEVNVKAAAVKRTQYKTPQIYSGQKLADARPSFTYVSTVGGETVPGTLLFDEDDAPVSGVGTKYYDAEFFPDSKNYCSLKDSVNVRVVAATPEIVSFPVARRNGIYGEKLENIALYSGACRNPYSLDVVPGHWEWKNPEQTLQMGVVSYALLFVPDSSEHVSVETSLTVLTEPQVMESVDFPESEDIVYGQRLAESELSFVKNSYGTFEWADGNLVPDVQTKGADVVFTPVDSTHYDWSKVSGYDQNTGTITCRIPLCVSQAEGTLPEIHAGTLVEGDSLEESELTYDSARGSVQWLNPGETAESAGSKDALFYPSDTVNYDWSTYMDAATKKIVIPVDVSVISRAAVQTEAEYGGRLGDVVLVPGDADSTCRWENEEEILSQTGLCDYPVIYVRDGIEYRRMMELNVNKKKQPVPVGITADGSAEGKPEGCIYGVNDRMEYRAESQEEYRSVAADTTVITGLLPGKYYVRYRETEYCFAGEETEIEVLSIPQPTPTVQITDTPEPAEPGDDTPEPVETGGPEITAAPEETETPVETKSSEVTEAPVETEMPVETEGPEATEPPVETEMPEATEVPAETEMPEATEVSVETEMPEATEAPVETEIPVKTGGPEATETPGETEGPEATETPVETESPEATATLCGTEEPCETVEPQTAGLPTDAQEPRATEPLADTPEPQAAAQTILASRPQATPASTKAALSPVSSAEPIIITKMASRISGIRSTVSVIPVRAKIKKIRRMGKNARVTCKKIKGVKYQIQYSQNRKFRKSMKSVYSKTKFTVKRLKANKIYYFRLRAFRRVNSQRVYGSWSKIKRS